MKPLYKVGDLIKITRTGGNDSFFTNSIGEKDYSDLFTFEDKVFKIDNILKGSIIDNSFSYRISIEGEGFGYIREGFFELYKGDPISSNYHETLEYFIRNEKNNKI